MFSCAHGSSSLSLLPVSRQRRVLGLILRKSVRGVVNTPFRPYSTGETGSPGDPSLSAALPPPAAPGKKDKLVVRVSFNTTPSGSPPKSSLPCEHLLHGPFQREKVEFCPAVSQPALVEEQFPVVVPCLSGAAENLPFQLEEKRSFSSPDFA